MYVSKYRKRHCKVSSHKFTKLSVATFVSLSTCMCAWRSGYQRVKGYSRDEIAADAVALPKIKKEKEIPF